MPSSDTQLFIMRSIENMKTLASELIKIGIAKPFFLPNSAGNFGFGTALMHTAVSTKVVQQKCKSVHDNEDWYYG